MNNLILEPLYPKQLKGRLQKFVRDDLKLILKLAL